MHITLQTLCAIDVVGDLNHNMSLHVSPPCNAITSTPFLQLTPFRFKSSSIPSDAKVFKATEIGTDLVVELESATIYESDSVEWPAYIPALLDSSTALQKVSHWLSGLKDLAGTLLYKNGAWSPYKIPFFLRCQADLGAGSSSCAAKPKPTKKSTSDPLSNMATQKAHSSGSHATKDAHLAPKAPRTSSCSLRWQVIQRKVSLGSEMEQVEETFIPAAGEEEKGTAVWLNSVANSFQPIATGPIQAPMDSDRPCTCGYVKCASLVLADVTPRRLWSVQFATKPIAGAIKIKPDLVLCASDLLSKTTQMWVHVISVMEVTSKPNDLDMLVNLAQKAYAVFVNQPGRHFLILVSIAAQIFRIHLYDQCHAPNMFGTVDMEKVS